MPTPDEAVATTGIAHNPLVHDYPNPLRIAIIGAGIGGLSTAIALRHQGHQVDIYEQSRSDQETGSVIHLVPNANGLLRRWGVFAESLGANEVLGLAEYTSTGVERTFKDLNRTNAMWQHPWHLVDGVLLHSKLEEYATTENGLGSPAIMHAQTRVKSVNGDACRIFLENGTFIDADMIVGADGVHSETRNAINSSSIKTKPYSTGKIAFHVLISRQVLLDDPITSPLVKRQNTISTWYGNDRRVIMCPCNQNNTLSFTFLHPDNESPPTLYKDWNTTGSIDQLLNLYQDFDPALKHMIKKVDSARVKCWQLFDMERLPSWGRRNLTLVGDAAHPFTPYQGQGAGQAMEDAAALATVLPKGTAPDAIPERLELFEKIRYQRAHRIQEFSRQAGQDYVEGNHTIDLDAYTNYNFGHDEIDNSTMIFKKWLWSKKRDIYWRMPTAFGPFPGPRQDAFGRPWGGHRERSFVTASIMFKTSRTYLESFFPSKSFKFRSPGTIAYSSIYITTLNNMSWLAGGGYTHCGLYIHDVEYIKRDGSTVYGTYLPVLFENLADPIISGRDELGMNKLYCEIDIDRIPGSYHMQCSWRGTKFFDVQLEHLKPDPPKMEALPADAAKDYGVLTYKYIPTTGEPGKADVEYACVIPHAEEAKIAQATIQTVSWSHKPNMEFKSKDWNSLPTLHHVSSALASMPIYEVVFAKVAEGLGVADVSSCRRIE